MSTDTELREAFKQLVAYYEQSEASGKNLAGILKRSANSANERLIPGAEPVVVQAHGAWYDTVQRGFDAAGFHPLGDHQNFDNSEKPADKRVFYRFALSPDALTAASWFCFTGKTEIRCVVLQSWGMTGAQRFATMSGATKSPLGGPPSDVSVYLPMDLPVEDLLRAHRDEIAKAREPLRQLNGLADILMLRDDDSAATKAYRKANAFSILDRMLREKHGENFDEVGAPIVAAVYRHPEWVYDDLAGVNVPSVRLASPLQLSFSSDNEGSDRRDITTFGMAAFGYPELRLNGIAANHMRAARFFLMAVGRKLVAEATSFSSPDTSLEDRLAGLETPIAFRDAPPKNESPVLGLRPDAEDVGPVVVRLEFAAASGAPEPKKGILARLMNKQRPARMLNVVPPRNSSAGRDDWLRNACRTLGLDAPDARPASAFQEVMNAASRSAVEDMPTVREKMSVGLPAGQSVVIKAGFPTTAGNREFVWILVTECPPGEIVGTLQSKPQAIPGLTRGQTMRVADADVFDYKVFSATEGVLQSGLTDLVAQDFGADVS